MANYKSAILGFVLFIVGLGLFFNAGVFIPSNTCGEILSGWSLLIAMAYEILTGLAIFGGIILLISSLSSGGAISAAFAVVLILGITLLVLLLAGIGIFSPGHFCGQLCILPSGLSCIDFFISTTGQLTLNLWQQTQNPITITGYNCSAGGNQLKVGIPILPASNQIYVNNSANVTIVMKCRSAAGQPLNLTPGKLFSGIIGVNYTDYKTGFPHVAYGRIVVKVS